MFKEFKARAKARRIKSLEEYVLLKQIEVDELGRYTGTSYRYIEKVIQAKQDLAVAKLKLSQLKGEE
jgi:hypothetical protein